MNLAVHRLEGDIREADTFYEDVHRLQEGTSLVGHCEFVMANPPTVDAEKVKTDLRLPFGLPGVNKGKKVTNGNDVSRRGRSGSGINVSNRRTLKPSATQTGWTSGVPTNLRCGRGA